MGCYDCVWHINLHLHNAYPAWAIPSCVATVLVLPRITSLSQRGARRSWPSTSWTMARLAWISDLAGVVNLACAVPSWRLVNKLVLYCTAQGFIAWGLKVQHTVDEQYFLLFSLLLVWQIRNGTALINYTMSYACTSCSSLVPSLYPYSELKWDWK